MAGAKPCNNVSWFFEWHGDYECDDDEGGAECLYEKSPKGVARDVHQKLDLEGEINDVRLAGSESVAASEPRSQRSATAGFVAAVASEPL